MGIFNFFKKAAEDTGEIINDPIILETHVKGSVIPLEKVPDPVFSQGVLGKGCGINPAEGKVYAPIDGTVSQIADTLHAIGLEAVGDLELLIHVGIDTVDMDGEGFQSCVKVGDSVKKGQLLLTMDLDKIKAAKHATTVITLVTNSDDYGDVELVCTGEEGIGREMLRISK